MKSNIDKYDVVHVIVKANRLCTCANCQCENEIEVDDICLLENDELICEECMYYDISDYMIKLAKRYD